jgi:hypothetical protein
MPAPAARPTAVISAAAARQCRPTSTLEHRLETVGQHPRGALRTGDDVVAASRRTEVR